MKANESYKESRTKNLVQLSVRVVSADMSSD